MSQFHGLHLKRLALASLMALQPMLDGCIATDIISSVFSAVGSGVGAVGSLFSGSQSAAPAPDPAAGQGQDVATTTPRVDGAGASAAGSGGGAVNGIESNAGSSGAAGPLTLGMAGGRPIPDQAPGTMFPNDPAMGSSGPRVGLPPGTLGNSSAGLLAPGAGLVVPGAQPGKPGGGAPVPGGGQTTPQQLTLRGPIAQPGAGTTVRQGTSTAGTPQTLLLQGRVTQNNVLARPTGGTSSQNRITTTNVSGRVIPSTTTRPSGGSTAGNARPQPAAATQTGRYTNLLRAVEGARQDYGAEQTAWTEAANNFGNVVGTAAGIATAFIPGLGPAAQIGIPPLAGWAATQYYNGAQIPRSTAQLQQLNQVRDMVNRQQK